MIQPKRRFHQTATSSYTKYNQLMGQSTSTARSKAEVIYTDQGGQPQNRLTATYQSGDHHGNQWDCSTLDHRYMTRPDQSKRERKTQQINKYCAEVQVIHELHPLLQQLIGAQASDILVRIFTTWTPCAACEHDIGVLHSIFPQAEIVVRGGSQYKADRQYQAPTLGTQYNNAHKQDRLKWQRYHSNQPQPPPPTTTTTQTNAPTQVTQSNTNSQVTLPNHTQVLPPNTSQQVTSPTPTQHQPTLPQSVSPSQQTGGGFGGGYVPYFMPMPYPPMPYPPMPYQPMNMNVGYHNYQYPTMYPPVYTPFGYGPVYGHTGGGPTPNMNMQVGPQLPPGATLDPSGTGYVLNGIFYPL